MLSAKQGERLSVVTSAGGQVGGGEYTPSVTVTVSCHRQIKEITTTLQTTLLDYWLADGAP